MRKFFELDCGRSVAVEAVYFGRTYVSLLEGWPDAQMNEEIIEQARTEMASLWGNA